MIDFEYRGIYKVFNEFKKLYPELVRRGMSYEPYDKESIMVYIPGVGKLIYENYYHRITWLEHWEDEKLIKQQEKERRPEMYEKFCNIIECYMKVHHLTHQQFSDMVGISSRSITKYLNGDSMPKASTMKRICKIIDIEL